MADIRKEAEENEIDLLELAHKLWSKKKFIIKISLIGFVVGVIVAFSIPREYTTIVILTSESSKGSTGGMGALASMAGINLQRADAEIFSSELYPEVLNSTPFVQGLLNINVVDSKQEINTTLYNYIKEDQKVAWWSYILKAPGTLIGLFSSDDDPLVSDTTNINHRFISVQDLGIIDAIKGSYSASTDKKTGVTTIMVTAQSPKISAYLADTITSYLQTYIIDKRTQKARVDLTNTKGLYERAKADYYKAQQNLASFTDGNINIVSAKFNINKEKLQNEAELAYSVYNQMAQQVQINEIKVQDDTPVFTVIQPAVEPIFPEKPKKKVIVLVFLCIAFTSSAFWSIKSNILRMLQ